MPRIGWLVCQLCGNAEAAVSETSTGTLSLACHKCQFSGYAKSSTKAAKLIRAALRPDEDGGAPAPAAAPAPVATRKAAPAPAPAAPRSNAFDLGALR